MLNFKRKCMNLFFLFIFTLLLKTYFVRLELFRDSSIIKVIFFESGFILVFLSIIEIFFKRARLYLYFIFDFLYSFFLLTVLLYNKQFGRIVNYHSLSNIAQLPAVKSSIAALLQPGYLLLFIDFIILPILFIIWRKRHDEGLFNFKPRQHYRRLLAVLISFAVISPSAGYIIQGTDFNGRSLDVASQIGLCNYQVFEALSTYLKNRDDKFNSSMEQIDDLKGITEVKNPEYSGLASGKNVIFLQVEALQNFVIGLKIDGTELTPNLNKLIGQSIYFPGFYSQIAQGNTSDAEFIANTSLYPLEEGTIATDYSNREFPSLPKLLKSSGYECMTFHPNVITFWSRDKLYPALGFDRTYDVTFFGDNDIVGLGPSDDVLYSKTEDVLHQMSESDKKYYASIVTLSNHHPFDIPDDKKTFSLPESFKDSFVGDYLESVSYTDAAIGRFMEMLEKDNLLDNTLLVVYGDHYGIPCDTLDNKNKELMEKLLERPYRTIDTFNVPLIIRLPGGGTGKTVNTAGGQIDIMPTVMNLLGISMEGTIYFGRDILNYSQNTVGIRYYMPSGSFINNDLVSVRGGSKTYLSTGEKVNKNFSPQENRVMELEDLSDEYIRSLPIRK